MDLKLLATVFGTIFLAELGDKTQLATFLYTTDSENSKLVIFLGASGALVLASGLAVVAGAVISEYVSAKVLSWVAGLGFIAVGVWTLVRAQGAV